MTKRLGTKNKGPSWDGGSCGGRLKKRPLWMWACKCAKHLQWESGNLFSVKGPHQQCTQERLTQWKRERELDGVSQPRPKKENIVSFPSPPHSFAVTFCLFFKTTKPETPESPMRFICMSARLVGWERNRSSQHTLLAYLPDSLWMLSSCMVAYSVISGSHEMFDHPSLSGYLMKPAC